MNPDQLALQAQAQAMLRRQQQVLKNINDELAFSQNKLREMSKLRDNLLSRLFPPMRADRNSEHVLAQLKKHLGESKELQQAIVEQETEIRVLEAEMVREDIATRLTQGRDNLLNLRQKLLIANSDVEKMRDIISPVRVLPPEIVGCIFNYAQESRFSSDEPRPDLISITHVCSSWRSIAINTPSLWSNIRVTVQGGINKSGWLSLIELWLERSKAHPLRFKLRETESLDVSPTTDSDFFRILDLYIPHTGRWKSVTLTNSQFCVPGWLWFSKIPPEASCPLLESLSLKCDLLEDNDISQLRMLTNRSPRLRQLTWRYNGEPSHPEFPWAQLTHLILISLVDLNEVLHILASGPNLISVDFTLQAHSSMVDHRQSRIVHQNLKSLTLGISGDLAVLLDFLTLPNLTTFSVDILPPMVIMVTLGGSNAGWKHDEFMTFLQRSQCKLQVVSFLDVKLEPRELLSLLHYLSPSLVDFTMENIRWSCVTDEVLKSLTYPSSSDSSLTEGQPSPQGTLAGGESTTLCPRLNCIRFWGCMESTDGVLADMVESRVHPPKDSTDLTALKIAHFGVHPDRAQLQDLQRIEAMRKDFHDVAYSSLELDEVRELIQFP